MQVIKWINSPYWEQSIILDNKPYILSGNFNIRDNNWYINLLTNDNISLIEGKKLVIGIDLLNNIYSELKPDGYLMAVPINEIVREITRDNMGTEIELIYISNNEIF